MFNNRISLTPQDIFDKDFKIDTRGYRLQEVDKFLDQIIKDYIEFINIIKELNLLESDYGEFAKFGHYTKAYA